MKIANNCRVRMNYAIRLEGGELVEENPPGEPLEFVVGQEQVLPAVERGIMGLAEGEKKRFEVPPEEGFGFRDPQAIRVVSRNDLEDHGDILEEGMMLRLRDESGNTLVLTVVSVDEEEVVFDLNHPLAGAHLLFDVEILEVQEEAGLPPN